MPTYKNAEGQGMLDETVTRLKNKMAMSELFCLDCWHFDRSEKEIINYEGERVRVMRGCNNYRDCHRGGHKSLWAAR